MTTLREQIATNVLTVTKFRELMRDMRENRPTTISNSSARPTNFLSAITPASSAPPANPTWSTLSKSRLSSQK